MKKVAPFQRTFEVMNEEQENLQGLMKAYILRDQENVIEL